jgi:hypothetical protein
VGPRAGVNASSRSASARSLHRQDPDIAASAIALAPCRLAVAFPHTMDEIRGIRGGSCLALTCMLSVSSCVYQGGAWLGREIDCGPAPLLDSCRW